MSRITQALSLVTALLSGGFYDSVQASSNNTAGPQMPVVQPMESNGEDRQAVLEARLKLGGELQRH